MNQGWLVQQVTEPAADFHARPLDAPVRRAVHVWPVEEPVLVLGSTQPDGVVDRAACKAAGVEVVRRRSGGGAVLLEPRSAACVDVELPRGDALWHDDVGRAAWWLGHRWAATLGPMGAAEPQVHRGGLVSTEWSPLVCFAGLGPGELTTGGRKVVGISQRRTRGGVRFQCAVALRWDVDRLARLLALTDPDRDRLVGDLNEAVAPLDQPAERVVAEFLEVLGSST